jgi:hypothetical protein
MLQACQLLQPMRMRIYRRGMPINLVSNQKFTENEWNKWHRQCEKDNRPQISVMDVENVTARLKKATKCASFPHLSSNIVMAVASKGC